MKTNTCLKTNDLTRLKNAVALLENPGFVSSVTNALSRPAESAFNLMSGRYFEMIHEAVPAALNIALKVAVKSLNKDSRGKPSNRMHKSLSVISGTLGGAFGTIALPLELSVSTTIMLRTIADIARSEGEPLESLDSRLACIQVLAFGGKCENGCDGENSYYYVRAMLARAVSEASAYIAEKGMIEEGAPALVRLITQIASRFGITVSEKFAAQAIPGIGAVAGASVNLLFVTHFQNIAKGHFTVRKLERIYGEDAVRVHYMKFAKRYGAKISPRGSFPHSTENSYG